MQLIYCKNYNYDFYVLTVRIHTEKLDIYLYRVRRMSFITAVSAYCTGMQSTSRILYLYASDGWIREKI